MWCFVSEPNGTIHEITLAKDCRGSECLDMVASRIHLVEKDYFGLWYKPRKGAGCWLNLRNRLCDEISGKAPHRFRLAVKFFVNVQELQQQVTRDLFYSTLIKQVSSGKISLTTVSQELIAKLLALMAQVTFGDFNADQVPEYSTLLSNVATWSDELQRLTESEHLKLDLLLSSEAKIQVIKLVSEFVDYGVEKFMVFSSTGSRKSDELLLCVRQDGLRIYTRDEETRGTTKTHETQLVQCITYDEISTVSYKGKRFTIIHGDPRTEHLHSTFLLRKNKGAINLFRTFTEFHSFFQCNIVKKSVIEKCSKSSLGRFMSIFKSDTDVGTMFLFDVYRTRRQAYDHAWSILNAPTSKRQSAYYHSERRNRKSVYSLSRLEEMNDYRHPSLHFNMFNNRTATNSITADRPNDAATRDASFLKNLKNKEGCSDGDKTCTRSPSPSKGGSDGTSLSVDELRAAMNDFLDTQTCQVCMDAKVSTAFCPCGHVVCCVVCSQLCRECPLCRVQITYAQRVFFSGI